MTTLQDQDLLVLATVTDELVAAVAAATEDQRSWETPCPDWDLSALLDHIAGGNWFTSGILNGDTSDVAMATAMNRFEGGSATMDQVIGSADKQLKAFCGDGVLEATWHHVVGDLPGRQVLRIRLHDLIVHTWDIKQTIDPPALITNSVLDWAVDELAMEDSRAAGLFGVEETTPAEPTKTSKTDTAAYLARFGRTPV